MIYGLGMQELLIILAIVMLLFGGKKLPEVGRNLGKAIRGFKDAEEETTKELKAAADPSTPRQDPGQAGETDRAAEGEEKVEEDEKKEASS